MTSLQYSEIFKALSDETRVKVIEMLTFEKQCGCQILKKLSISQPTLSHHMRILTQSGLVYAEKNGKWVYYGINQEAFAEVRSFVDSIGKGNPVCGCEVR